MDFGGNYIFSATRDRVWAALNDAETLKAAIPGCSRIEWTGENSLEVEITVNFGLIKPTFTGDLTLDNVRPAESYRLAGKGRGGMLGMAQGAADITLADAPGGTSLAFSATGGADGGIMKLGKALIGNSAQKVIDGFFERFGKAMGAEVKAV